MPPAHDAQAVGSSECLTEENRSKLPPLTVKNPAIVINSIYGTRRGRNVGPQLFEAHWEGRYGLS